MMRSLFRALGLAVLLPTITAAQQIRGVVVDDSTGQAIADAKIELLAGDTTARATTITAATGWFELRPPGGGQFLLIASHPAYQSVGTLAVALGPQEIITVVIRLRGGPFKMKPVIAKAAARDWLSGYRERARRGAFGRFITRADIDKYGASNISDALRFTPEVRIERVQQGAFNSEGAFMRSFGQLCVPAVFLDGMAIPTDGVFDITELLPVDAIEGIEVYRNLLTAPMEFRVAASSLQVEQDMCGVIAVWSRPMPGTPISWKRVIVAGLLFSVTPVLARIFR